MDPWVIVGALLGAVAPLVPGAHANALAALALAAGVGSAAAYAALLGAYTCAAPSVGAFLGASEETALSASPAHRFLAQGRAREAAELAADGALLGVLLALPCAVLALPLLHRSADGVAAIAPLAVLALAAFLVVSARRRLAAVVFFLASGAFGLAALQLGAASPLGLPASSLLAILAGLFGAPGLLTLVRLRDLPLQKHYRAAEPARWMLRMSGRGLAGGSLVGLLPALTPGVAASPFLARSRREEETVVALAAAAGAGAVFTLAALFALGRARSGALVAARIVEAPPAWTTLPPAQAAFWAAALLLGATLGYAIARLLAAVIPDVLNRAGARPVGLVGLALLLLSTLAFAGLLGLLVAATGCALGIACARAGAPRTVLLGSLLLPALLAMTGLR